MTTKAKAIKNAGMALKPGGTLFGATILGKEVPHNAFGKKLMAVYNKKGIFSNTNDSADTLRSVLDEHFAKVTLSNMAPLRYFPPLRHAHRKYRHFRAVGSAIMWV